MGETLNLARTWPPSPRARWHCAVDCGCQADRAKTDAQSREWQSAPCGLFVDLHARPSCMNSGADRLLHRNHSALPQASHRPAQGPRLAWLDRPDRTPASVFVWASALLATKHVVLRLRCTALLPRYRAISQCTLVPSLVVPSAHQWDLINEMPRHWPCRLALTPDCSSESEQRR